MRAEEARIRDTRAWVVRATEDLQTTELVLGVQPPLTETALFHCQQAVEKMLKAFLLWHDRPVRKTHNLVELGQECASVQPDLEPIIREAIVLTEFAWSGRYPDFRSSTGLDAGEALQIARRLYEAIAALLPAAAKA